MREITKWKKFLKMLSIEHMINWIKLFLYENKIIEFGNNAFSQLEALQSLQLDSNEINHINENSSDNYLDLFLNNCLLNSSSFEKKAFNNLKRPTILRLNFGSNSNNITFLDQHTFEEFLNNNDRKGI
jgi:hypothetical protein